MQPQRLSEAHLAATSAATSGDAGGLYRIVARLMEDGVPFEAILFDLLMVIEREIGHRWQQGDYLVAEEHAATATLETVVSLLAGSFDQPAEGRRVVVATAEGDTHSLPGRAVAAHLLFLGHRTTYLGGDVLSSDLAEYLEEEEPEALVVSCAMAVHLMGARSAIRVCHSSGVPVLVGGRGFGEYGAWAARLGADAWAPSLQSVADILESWSPNPRAAEAAVADPPPELVSLTALRPLVVARAYAELQGGADDASRRETAVRLLLGAVEAALLVDDRGPLLDMLRWQKTTLPVHGLGEASTVATAVRSVLETIAPLAAEILRRSAEDAGV